MNKTLHRPSRSASWDGVADWYTGWAGRDGSWYHRNIAVPLLLELLDLKAGERLADLGCGHGILAPHVAQRGAGMIGVDLSPKLIATARRQHGSRARFVVGNATALPAIPGLEDGSFDAAAFLLSIQDIAPLEGAIREAARLLRPGGRLAMVMLHPCFRVPRQSGWGFDEQRALHYRRVDSYMSELAVPMQGYGGGRTTRSYHRPLGAYFAALEGAGLTVTALREACDTGTGPRKAERRAMREFPLMLGLGARKAG
jgi:ubiquinone/menaquinone biosynthesis C-methylase UbiE